jgi:hypothetical protein
MKDGQFLLTNYGVKVELDTTPFGASRTWVALDQGFNNLDEALNDQVQEYFFLGDKGFGSDYVTGVHPKYKLTGTRVVGDPCQDYIFDNKFNLMNGRTTNLRISLPRADGSVIRFTNKVALTEMKSFGGSANEGSSVEVTLSFMGAPFVDTVVLTTDLVVTTAAGANPGETVITVLPTYPDAGCKYVYAIDPTTTPVAVIGEVLTTWTDFTNNSTYEIPNGYKLTVASVNQATYKVVGFGSTTVVANTGTALTVVSEAGTSTGKSKITITPAAGTGESFVYKVDSAAIPVNINDDLSTWTAIASGDEITATSGQYITVGLVNDTTKLALGSGSAVVVSAT